MDELHEALVRHDDLAALDVARHLVGLPRMGGR
jgi:hypothetical protein